MCRRCLRHSAGTKVVVDCGATLIVCPEPILAQWRSEIDRHTLPGMQSYRHSDICLRLVDDGLTQNASITAIAEHSNGCSRYGVLCYRLGFAMQPQSTFNAAMVMGARCCQCCGV